MDISVYSNGLVLEDDNLFLPKDSSLFKQFSEGISKGFDCHVKIFIIFPIIFLSNSSLLIYKNDSKRMLISIS